MASAMGGFGGRGAGAGSYLTWLLVAGLLTAVAAVGAIIAGDRPMLAMMYVIACGGLLLFILHRPQPLTLLYLLIFITPLGVLTKIPGTETTVRPFVGMALAGFWILAMLLERNRLILTRELGYLAVFMAAVFVTSLVQDSPRDSIRPLFTYAQIFVLVFLMVQNLTTVGKVTTTLWLMALSLTIVGCFMIITGVGIGNIAAYRTLYSSGSYARVSSIYDTSGGSGFIMAVAMVVSVIMLRMTQGLLPRIILVVSLAISTAGLLFSLTLSTILAALTALPLAMLRHTRISLRTMSLYAVGLVAIGTILYFSFPPITARIHDHYDSMTSEHNLRLFTWRGALDIFTQNPVLGVGAGNTERDMGYHFPVWHPKFGRSRAAHNTYLGIAADHGLVGLIPFALLAVGLGRGLYRTANRAEDRGQKDLALLCQGVLTVLAASLVPMFFLNLEREDFIWLFIGLGMALINIGNQMEPDPPAGGDPVPAVKA